MQYIIMCGGQYNEWETPRQLMEINGEKIIQRTVRLLKENGIDPYITTNNPIFEQFAPVIHHDNEYLAYDGRIVKGHWNNAFYLSDDPTCYLFGDVVYSPEAIKTIVEYQTDDIMFFASAPPFSKDYIKPYAEPFAFKVENMEHLKAAIKKENEIEEQGLFYRQPIAWELWQVISGAKPGYIDYNSYVHINDYTCDVDRPRDLIKLTEVMQWK